jgi:hypothetical protein
MAGRNTRSHMEQGPLLPTHPPTVLSLSLYTSLQPPLAGPLPFPLGPAYRQGSNTAGRGWR